MCGIDEYIGGHDYILAWNLREESSPFSVESDKGHVPLPRQSGLPSGWHL